MRNVLEPLEDIDWHWFVRIRLRLWLVKCLMRFATLFLCEKCEMEAKYILPTASSCLFLDLERYAKPTIAIFSRTSVSSEAAVLKLFVMMRERLAGRSINVNHNSVLLRQLTHMTRRKIFYLVLLDTVGESVSNIPRQSKSLKLYWIASALSVDKFCESIKAEIKIITSSTWQLVGSDTIREFHFVTFHSRNCK